VTLILQALICFITYILSPAFSIIFVFFSSMSDLLMSNASSNLGTGV
jgi:hypothetical protein